MCFSDSPEPPGPPPTFKSSSKKLKKFPRGCDLLNTLFDWFACWLFTKKSSSYWPIDTRTEFPSLSKRGLSSGLFPPARETFACTLQCQPPPPLCRRRATLLLVLTSCPMGPPRLSTKESSCTKVTVSQMSFKLVSHLHFPPYITLPLCWRSS